ncbi:MAG TPA: tetratricopeptide repeat protein [Mariniphaga sp.]|nr:tetratricopeptide repeat protein [Mariniphaga sp.]
MMRKKNYKYIFFLLVFLSTINLFAQDDPDLLWEQANAYYTTEEFQKAASAYEQILQSGMVSAKLYFNLGNAYYKTGDINNAILNYERAKLLAPQDPDIEFNLRLVNQFVTTQIETLPQPFFVRWSNRIINLFPANTWAGISIGTFILFLAFVALFIFTRNSNLKMLAFWFGIFAIVASALSFSFAARQKAKINQRSHAIVFCPRITVKSAPSETSTDLFLLYEGVKVEVSDSVNTWKEIKLPDGNVGWLPDSCIVRI